MGGTTKAFPPTLTARIVIKELVTGDLVRTWATNSRDQSLTAPVEDEAFQEWRYAKSVRGAVRRATFRITRDFAMLSWKKHKVSNSSFTQTDAWANVRTAIADPQLSHFLAHTDATSCLGEALDLPDLSAFPVDKCARTVAWQLMSPRALATDKADCVKKLEQLSHAGLHDTIFMSYRWNRQMDHVADIGVELLNQGRGIWLDRLQIPALKSRPVWRVRGKSRRKDPPREDLESLLHDAIKRSAFFLCLAAEDYADPPGNDPAGVNWARKELDYALGCLQSGGQPRLGFVDLGGAPAALNSIEGQRWRYSDQAEGIARLVAAESGG